MRKGELVFSRAGLREVDRRAVEEFGISILVLMENAGRAVAEEGRRMLKAGGGNGVVVLAGAGNNGGDGLVAARFLHNWGVKVMVLLMAGRESYKGAAGVQLGIVEAMKVAVEVVTVGHAEFRDWVVEGGPEDVVIDAIFGTGLSRKVEGVAEEVIGAVNKSGRRILAVDIPSGMDADSGEAMGVAIKAAETVSFCGLKKGFVASGGNGYTGRVVVADIGVPRELLVALAEK